MRSSLSTMFFCGCLLTVPWVGVGVIRFFSGHDVGGGLQPSWLFLALAMGALAVEKLRLGKLSGMPGALNKPPLFLILISCGSLLAVLVSGLGLWAAPSPEPLTSGLGRWAKQIVQLLIMFSFLWWVALWVRGSRRWQLTLDFLFLGATFQIIYSLLQGLNFFHPMVVYSQLEMLFTSNPSILSGSEKLYLNNVLQEIPRLRGTVCEPLYLGNFLVMVWPFLLVWRRPLWMRWMLGALLLVLMVLTWSRGAWLGFMGQLFLLLAGFLLMKFKNHGNDKLKSSPASLWFLALLLLVVVLVDSFSGGWILNRLMASFNNQDWSNLTRLYSIKAAWLAFLSSPVVGIGWGQFAFHFPLLVDPMGLQSQFSWPVVNNFPLQILCETGLIGFVALLGTGLWLAISTWRIQIQGQSLIPSGSMVLAAALGVWGVWIQLMTFSQYNLPHIWLGLGLLMAALIEQQQGLSSAENRNTP